MLLRFDTIARTADFDDRAAAMQLRPWQWRFLLAADGRTRLDDLAHASGIDSDTAVDLAHETENLGLIEIVAQTLAQYRESQRSLAVANAPLTFAANASAPIEAEMPLDAPAPSAPALPAKALSVSFDAMATMFSKAPALAPAPHVDESASAVAAPDVVAHEAEAPEVGSHDTSDDMPFAFETPDHMEPLGDRAAAFGVPPTAYESPEPELEHADVAAPVKSVSFSLIADSFGAPSPAFVSDHADVTSNGHAHVDHAHLGSPEPVATNGRSEYADMFAQEHHDAHAAEALEPISTHDVVTEPAPEMTRPADDVLLQHFHVPASAVDGEAHAFGAPSGFESEVMKTGGDLTGNLLRALGLKK